MIILFFKKIDLNYLKEGLEYNYQCS